MTKVGAIYKMFVYALRCSDGTYYIGVTNDLERRIDEHQTGYNTDAYTYYRRPVTLVYWVGFNDHLAAIAFEKRLKKWSKLKKEALFTGNLESLSDLSKKGFENR